MSFKDSPFANLEPTSLFLEKSPVQVSTRSPAPDKPLNVSILAPTLRPNLEISANPLVIRAALALLPKPMPSDMPDAIAITFFRAPATETPTTSVLV